jgi:hypothetical protein
MRYVLIPLYEAKGQKGWVGRYPINRAPISRRSNRVGSCKPYSKGLGGQMTTRLARYLQMKSCQCKLINPAKLDVIDLKTCRFSPVFHEWFLETFPEPSTWLTSRLVYTRSAAVMSMVGFILGYETIYYLSNTSSKLRIIDWGIGIARTSCWTLIPEALFTLTSTACLKR